MKIEIFTKPFYHSVYVKMYKVITNEADKQIDVFRELKKDVRMFDGTPNHLISPVDAVIEQFGIMPSEESTAVKKQPYSIKDMLGDCALAEKYINGSFIVLYLSPSYYQRIHSPDSGKVIRQY